MKTSHAALVASASLVLAQAVQAANDLYISEYIEGSSNNKAIEIVNRTGAAVDLSAYELQMYFNGNTSAGTSIALSGVIADGDVFVVADDGADPAILAVTDQISTSSFFNGDDAVVLANGGVPVDVIGQIGVDPGSEWGSGDTSTKDNTIRRKTSVSDGDNDGSNTFDPVAEWEGFPVNSFDDLGVYGSPSIDLVINEVDADTTGTDTQEFIELFDGGIGNSSLDGYIVVLYNGSNDSSYDTIDLTGYSTDANGYFVIGNADVANVSIMLPSNGIQNGADAVAVYQANAADFPNGSAISLDNLVDAVVYDTNDGDDAGLLPLLNEAQPQLNEGENGNKDGESNQRCENGAGGARNTDGFVQAVPTPGETNSCAPVVVEQCGDPATLISAIQGNGASSPMNGAPATVEAVVVGDFQGSDNLRGYFLQEEDADQDGDSSTSEGLFVYDSSTLLDVAVGDLVRVSGSVTEFNDLTELTNLSAAEICASGISVSAADLSLPATSSDALEAVEGMLVNSAQTLTVSGNYNLGRYGELVLSANGRLMNPTQVALPGADAAAVAASNDLNRIILDDGKTGQNPDPIAYPAPGLSAANTVRSGDTVDNLEGVMTYAFGAWRVHPVGDVNIVPANLRSAEPELAADGNLRIASYNVLNYFNGASGFPTARGADSASEFDRQRDKIISAIVAIDADILGLIEIENNGYGTDSAIQDLVNGLADAGLSYNFVDPGVAQIGTDAIAVGFLYKSDTVGLQGNAAILDSSVDPEFIDTKNRPVLAQTFVALETGDAMTLAVSHLKSKGSNCDSLGDPNADDGQGNCNLTRTRAATAMVNWLAGDPTSSGDDDFLIMGDLNAYAKEDPIAAIEAAGYTNVVAQFASGAYSYVFDAESGSLDHALASSSLMAKVVAAADWHINADEPRSLDYNEEFKSADQIVNLYAADAYRSSDHDPLVLELETELNIVGDFNGDGRLSLRDYFMLLFKLRQPVEGNEQYDLNEDGRISGRDLAAWWRLYRQQ